MRSRRDELTSSGGCGSFYAILISSPKFNGLSTIKQHKLVNACLKEDIQGIHGLQVSFLISLLILCGVLRGRELTVQLKTIPEEE
jgi:stress-induced morphogen